MEGSLGMGIGLLPGVGERGFSSRSGLRREEDEDMVCSALRAVCEALVMASLVYRSIAGTFEPYLRAIPTSA